MKLRTDRAVLADAATWVAQAIAKRPTTPALGGLRLTGDGNTLTLAAFDYDAAHTARISAEVVTDGEVLVSGLMLRNIVSAVKGNEVELAVDDARLTVQAGRSTYRLGIMPLADYPTLPDFPTPVGSVTAEDLAHLVGTVEHAAARNDTVAILEAINLTCDGARLTGFATDRFRIAQAAVAVSDGVSFEANVVAATLSTALKGMSGQVDLGFEGGSFGLSDGRRSVVVRVIDEQHVRVGSFFTAQPKVTVEVDTAALADALKRTSLVASDDADRVLVTVTEDEITLTSGSTAAEGAEYVECTADGQIEALFNGAYLMQSLVAVAPGRARLGFADGMKPLTIHPLDTDADQAAVVMPRRRTA